MKKYIFATLCAVAAMLIGCDKPAGGDETGSGITVTGGTTIEAEANQTTATFAITAEAAWTASIESGAEWLLEVTPANGEAGSHTLTLNFTANETETARTATVRLASGDGAVTVSLNQKGVVEQLPDPEGTAILKSWSNDGPSGAVVLKTDEQGRIIAEGFERDGQFVPNIELSYTDNLLTMTEYITDELQSVSTYELRDGRVVRGIEIDGKPSQDTFTYNPDGSLASCRIHETYPAYEDPSNPGQGDQWLETYYSTYTYTWTDGNITKIDYEMDSEQGSFLIEYGQETSGIKNFDLLPMIAPTSNNFMRYRLTGPMTRNLPTVVEYRQDENFRVELAYTFNEEVGAVSEIYYKEGNLLYLSFGY